MNTMINPHPHVENDFGLAHEGWAWLGETSSNRCVPGEATVRSGGDRLALAAKTRPRVMVVDDDPIVAFLLAQALQRGGYEVEVFSNGPAALESFERLETDLVVADWIMPGLDGLSLIDILKSRAPKLPAMLITGFGEHETVRQAHEAGRVDAVFSKPFDLQKFLETVSLFLFQMPETAAVLPKLGPQADGPPAQLGSVDGWRSLAVREGYFEQMLESVIDAVIMVDKDQRVVYRNRGAERMFDLKDRSKGLTLNDFCPAGSRLPAILASYFQPHPPVEEQSEAFFRRATGEEFYAVFSASLFAPAWKDPTVLLFIKDINDRHHFTEKRLLEQAKDLELLALTDPLTGLYNRRYFDRRLDEEFKRMERYHSCLTLIMLDFDHFKLINDYHGHLIGDKVLQISSKLLTHVLRDIDTVARWGGEEFMVLLPETGWETGLAVARRLHSLVGHSDRWAELSPDLKVTVSLGVVSLPWHHQPMAVKQTLEVLDRALYRAKNAGRNRVAMYRDETGCFDLD